MKYIISGGGTGGHIYPALAIAEEIQRQDRNAEILYVGTENGLESELVPRAGYRFATVRVSGLPRKINFEFFKSIGRLILGLMDANKLVRKFEPDVVIGTGGYVSGPIVLMGKLNRKKTFIHEQNVYPGITNKILARMVDKVGVTFEDSKKYFKKTDKIVVTGNPTRRELLEIDKDKAYNKLKIDRENKFVLSFGGSGGQVAINKAILDMLKEEDSLDFQLLHVTGKRLYDKFMDDYEDIQDKHPNVIIEPYLHNMPEALNIADLVISSSGAITLAEIAIIGIPSILIPKSYSAEDHQIYNAKSFVKRGASTMIYEENLSGDILLKDIENIIKNEQKIEKMKENSKKLANIKATEDIVSTILNL